jgi:hypothetical protein
MIRPVLVLALAASAICTSASAVPARHKTHRVNLAAMNLEPRHDLVRATDRRAFAPDAMPTSFHYALPAPGMGAVLGYKPFVDSHLIQGYEVNQATAIGFSQPSSSVGAALAYRF